MSKELAFDIVSSDGDITIEAVKDNNNVLDVKLDGKEAVITYGGGKSRFFRGLGLLFEAISDGKARVEIHEKHLFLHMK